MALREPGADLKSERMAKLAGLVAGTMGLSAKAASVVELAASVKDVGRLAVPDAVLARSGPLTTQEWQQMTGHVLAAEALLLKIPELRALAPVVRATHERWDGGGYPDGRAGESIPLPSRIIAACDAFVAMTSDRAFRGALDEVTAIQQVKEMAGTQLDPTVAKALVAHLSGHKVPHNGSASDSRVSAHDGIDVKDLLARLERLEPLPALLIAHERLVGALGESHPDPDQVIPQIESDPGLAVAVLAAANRTAPRPTIWSILEARHVLGWPELEQVVKGTPALDFLWPQNEWEALLESFRLHAAAVQRAAVRLAEASGYEDVDRLAVAALLHDIGRLALCQLRSGYVARLRGARTAEERLRMERRDFGLDHAAVGGIIARRHGLPEALAKAISEHHTEDAGPVVQLVRLADALAHHSQGKSPLHESMIDLARSLGLTPDDLRTITFELPHSRGSRRVRTEPCPLTRRELDALRGLADGKVYKEIGDALGLSTSTVRTHLHNAYRKLDVNDRAQAVLMATQRGWL